MSEHKPITGEELAEMKTQCELQKRPFTHEVAQKHLLRCIAEVERLRAVIRQHWEEKACPLIDDAEACERLDASDFSLRVDAGRSK